MHRKNITILLTTIYSTSLLLCGCMKKSDFDFDKFSPEIEIEPIIVAPLLHTSLTSKNFVSITDSKESDYVIEYGSDGLVSFNYRDTVYNETPVTSSRGIITVPVQGEVDVALFRNTNSITFDFYSIGATFTSVINVNVSENACVAKNIRLEIYNRAGKMLPVNIDEEYHFSADQDEFVRMLSIDISGQFSEIVPRFVKYYMEVEYDPDLFTGEIPKAIKSTCISTVHIPFHGYTDGLIIADTIDFNFTSDLDIDKMEYVKMQILFHNNFPSDIACDLAFLDENYNERARFLAGGHLIPSPPVQNELSSGTSHSENLEQCDADRVAIMEKCKYMTINAIFTTTGIENKQNVKFLEKNYLGIDIIVTAKRKWNTNELF